MPALGAVPRPFDPAELKYSADRRLSLAGVDINATRGLTFGPLPVEDQGQMGACAAFAAELCGRLSIGETLLRAGVNRPDLVPLLSAKRLHQGWLYYNARKRRGWLINGDTGSTLADNLDLMCAGAPLLEVSPYVADWRWAPPVALETAPRADITLRHEPIYAGQMVEYIAAALDAGHPVQIGMNWYQEWMDPPASWRGVLSMPRNGGQGVGGHSITVWKRQNGMAVAQNQWDAGWNRGAESNGVPAGHCLLPFELFTKGIVWEARAVVSETELPPLIDPPQPKPDPKPDPKPVGGATVQVRRWRPKPGGGWDYPVVVQGDDPEYGPGDQYDVVFTWPDGTTTGNQVFYFPR